MTPEKGIKVVDEDTPVHPSMEARHEGEVACPDCGTVVLKYANAREPASGYVCQCPCGTDVAVDAGKGIVHNRDRKNAKPEAADGA